jgi:hypothetical protein
VIGKLICWILGHRAQWGMNRNSGTLMPECSRCKQAITASNDGHRDPFYL